jgi:hypothetical protein
MRSKKTKKLKKIAECNQKDAYIDETTINRFHRAGIEIDNPLILEFYRALKNEKLFGIFSRWYSFCKLTYIQKAAALNNMRPLLIGNLKVMPYDSRFLKRIRIIEASFKENDDKNCKWPKLPKSEYLGTYAKQYFRDKNIPLTHSKLYYQLLFGIINSVVGGLLVLGLIYYFWGGVVLSMIMALLFICFGVLIYNCVKFGFFPPQLQKLKLNNGKRFI